MNSKNILGGVILAAGIFSGCSNNNEVKENNEALTDSTTVIKDSVNKTLMEIINTDTHNYRKKYLKRKKIPLYDETNNIVEPRTKEDSINCRGTQLINMYETWIEDGDEMKKCLEKNNNHEYHSGRFIADDSEREDNQEILDYDSDKDYLFVRKLK